VCHAVTLEQSGGGAGPLPLAPGRGLAGLQHAEEKRLAATAEVPYYIALAEMGRPAGGAGGMRALRDTHSWTKFDRHHTLTLNTYVIVAKYHSQQKTDGGQLFCFTLSAVDRHTDKLEAGLGDILCWQKWTRGTSIGEIFRKRYPGMYV